MLGWVYLESSSTISLKFIGRQRHVDHVCIPLALTHVFVVWFDSVSRVPAEDLLKTYVVESFLFLLMARYVFSRSQDLVFPHVKSNAVQKHYKRAVFTK